MQLLNRLKWGANWDDAKAVKGLTVALPNVVHIIPHQVLDFLLLFFFSFFSLFLFHYESWFACFCHHHT